MVVEIAFLWVIILFNPITGNATTNCTHAGAFISIAKHVTVARNSAFKHNLVLRLDID